MLIGALPAASNRATWVENFEFVDATDDSPIDFSVCDEIVITIRDPYLSDNLITLKKSTGQVTTPNQGVISVRAEAGTMGGLDPKTYEVALETHTGGDVDQLILGTLPVLGW